MGGLFGLMAAAGSGAIGYLVFWTLSRERARRWREAAAEAGLIAVETSTTLGCTTRLTGRAGPLFVTLSTYRRGRYESGTRIAIRGFRHGTYGLTVRAEGVSSAIEKTFGEKELEIGDEAFDSAAYLQGAPALARAIFDHETRRQMEPLLRGALPVKGPDGARTLKVRASLAGDVLQVDIPSTVFRSNDAWIPAALLALLEVGGRLVRPDSVAERIAENLQGEPVAEVRLASLRTLSSEFADHPAARDALRRGLEDRDIDVRLLAATALGPEGRSRLVRLATGPAPDRVAAVAVAALADALPVDAAIERLRKARGAREEATALACIDRVGRAGTAAAIEALQKVLEEESDDLAAAATRALGLAAGHVGEPGPAEDQLERALVSALGHRSADVRIAAAEALGRIGTPLAVPPLREATSGRTLDGALRRATRQAIAQIQSRVKGASPGQLTLAGESGGQLSLAEDDRRGQVSLEPAGVSQDVETSLAEGQPPSPPDRTRAQEHEATGGDPAASNRRRAQALQGDRRQGSTGG